MSMATKMLSSREETRKLKTVRFPVKSQGYIPRGMHPVIYDHKRGLWVCRDDGCHYQILSVKLDARLERPVSTVSGHVMWIT